MNSKNTDQKATACQKTPQERGESTPNIEMKLERNYDDAMVEDLAKTHAQTLVKLDKAKAHADKLAEAIRQAIGKMRQAGIGFGETELREALAAYESEVGK